jgi:hypothetical protein
LSAPAGLTGSTVSVCRNGNCHAAILPAAPDASGPGAHVPFADATFLVGTLWKDANQGIELDIEWREAGQVQDGDRYQVTLTDVAGTTMALLDKTATYRKVSPNGDECGPICWSTELTP